MITLCLLIFSFQSLHLAIIYVVIRTVLQFVVIVPVAAPTIVG
jgi:hypothetical protein